MKINRNNYEAFFLDYHEGNLDDKAKAEVLAFLEGNPELKEEFESFEMIAVPGFTAPAFPGKENLKKSSITTNNYKTWLVALEENDLNEHEKKEVIQYLEKNHEAQRELEILRQTKILPDYSIRFRQKSSLKKGAVIIPMWVRLAAAACLLLGLLGYYFTIQKPSSEIVKQDFPKAQEPVKEEVIPSVQKNLTESRQEIFPVPAAEKKTSIQKKEKPAKKEIVKPAENLAENQVPEQVPAEEQKNIQEAAQPNIVINEKSPRKEIQGQKMVVLDDNDLADLGLKEKKMTSDPSLLSDAMDNVGKLFNVNAKYDKEHDANSAKYKETFALGPLAFTRTVNR